ncbi:hypothetical protein FOXYS1_7117 [Fusarium oxysporum]|uniref:Uncharacterized protein n=1 Tax=Fusarium oxysporum TaxID=5507 RepID=A0A8H5AB91_FUSOX|nr:hypothetical protein FOXYS1_7117 [Fusarium oxysporum]
MLASPASLSPVTSTSTPTPTSIPSAFSRLSQSRTVAKQLQETAVVALPANPTIEDLPKIVWENRRFIHEGSLARNGAKGRKSWIRSHGTFLIELNHHDQPIGHVWCCSKCDRKGAVDPSYYTTPKRGRLEQSIIPRAKVRAIQELSVGFVVDSDVPFTIFEHSFLRKLFNQFDRELVLQIPWSGSSITRELQRPFEVKRDVIKAELQDALTTIHLSFDLWTPPNRFAVMALGSHNGENLASTLIEVAQEWNIEEQIRTFISDNVTTNDTCLHHVYKAFNPSLRPDDVKARRMRCYGHVLNHVARAFLFGTDADAFELVSEINNIRGLAEQDLAHWRTKGPIGKLHNIVKFIKSSPQRSEQFKRIAQGQNHEGYRPCEESTAELEVIECARRQSHSSFTAVLGVPGFRTVTPNSTRYVSIGGNMGRKY